LDRFLYIASLIFAPLGLGLLVALVYELAERHMRKSKRSEDAGA
jgi:hypothetical protein